MSRRRRSSYRGEEEVKTILDADGKFVGIEMPDGTRATPRDIVPEARAKAEAWDEADAERRAARKED